jgi:hypothetical protein
MPPFLTSALDGGEEPASRPNRFISGEETPGTHCIGGWVDPRTGLHAMENRETLLFSGTEPRSSST